MTLRSLFRLRLVPAWLALAAPAHADTVAVGLLAPDLSSLAAPLLAAAEKTLGEVSGLELVRAPSPAPSGPCEAASCWLSRAKESGADLQLFVGLDGLTLSALLVDVPSARVTRTRSVEVTSVDFAAALRPLVDGLLPAFARKGWGGLTVSPGAPAQVKLDGKRVSVSAERPLAVTASVHTLDVLFDSGAAVLQRLAVPEGGRLNLPVDPVLMWGEPPGAGAVPIAHDERLRMGSFALWAVGALSVAGSLLAGAASRTQASHLATCQGADRSCEPQPEASSRRELAVTYARTANVLLGVGAVGLVGGAGLFTFDLWKGEKK